MLRLTSRIAALFAASLVVSTAYAADLPPAVAYPPPPPPVAFASGWYLRGDIGASIVQAQSFDYIRDPRNINDFSINHFSIGDAALFDVGVGYQFNSWLRLDVTGEWRSRSKFYAIGAYTSFCPVLACDDTYHASVQSKVLLANGYLDLGTWYGVTPFVGVGIGTAYNSIIGLNDYGPQTGGSGKAPDTNKTEFAWAFHAGLAYDLTNNLKLEAAYRYLNYGSVQTQINCVGGCIPDTYRFRDLYSHDFKLGVRWMFDTFEPAPAYLPPLIRKG